MDMREIKYEIKLNDDGRPYIHLDENQKMEIEEKFMAIEVTRYVINSLIDPNKKAEELDEQTVIELAKCGNVLENLSNKIAFLIKERNNLIDELKSDNSKENE